MKRRSSYIVSALLLVGLLLVPVAAIAHNETSTTSNTNSRKNTAEHTHEDETEEEFEGRLDKLKTKYKVKLAVAEKLRLKGKCKPAQSMVGKLHTKFGNSVTKRTQAYDSLQKNLDKLVTRLKESNIDTLKLEEQVTELKTKISTYQTDLDVYKQALVDLKAVDCVSDPDAFQAALEEAREAHDKLLTDVKNIKSYLVNTIKPTLKSIREQLVDNEQDDTTENTEETEQESN